jgi:hypothetical protein
MPEDKLLISEEPAKFLIRNGDPVAVYRKNGALRFFKLVEVGYADLAEIYEPASQQL